MKHTRECGRPASDHERPVSRFRTQRWTPPNALTDRCRPVQSVVQAAGRVVAEGCMAMPLRANSARARAQCKHEVRGGQLPTMPTHMLRVPFKVDIR